MNDGICWSNVAGDTAQCNCLKGYTGETCGTAPEGKNQSCNCMITTDVKFIRNNQITIITPLLPLISVINNQLLLPACTDEEVPCLNFGTCADSNIDGVKECTCAGGYTGTSCETPPTGKKSEHNI